MDFLHVLGFVAFLCALYISSRRAKGMSRPYYHRWDVASPHPYIDAFRDVQGKRKGVVVTSHEDLRRLHQNYVKAYTGHAWEMEPFLDLIQGAIWEVMHGEYREEDREQLLDTLMRFERETIYYYYKSPFSLLPWGIRLRHSIYRDGTYMISVPLEEHRAMQYALLLDKEKRSEK